MRRSWVYYEKPVGYNEAQRTGRLTRAEKCSAAVFFGRFEYK